MSQETKFEKGMIVKHQRYPHWGQGSIEIVSDNTLHIFFEANPKKRLEMIGKNDRDLHVVVFGSNSAALPDKAEPIKYDMSFFSKSSSGTLYSINELKRTDIPKTSGVYGWYFDEAPPYVPLQGCTHVIVKTGLFSKKKYYLLYIGKAKDLRDRIFNYHIRGNHYAQGAMSSLRLTLGCLFARKWGTYLGMDTNQRQSFGEGDQKLNQWLKKHALINWIETENHGEAETQYIDFYTLPLNTADNNHPFSMEKTGPVSILKEKYKEIANSGRCTKKLCKTAYKDFEKQCKLLGYKK